MPDDANGNYSLPTGYLAVTGSKVLASQHNPPLEDIAAVMTDRYPRDGRAPMLGDVRMNGNKAIGMADGTLATDAATVGQVPALGATATAAATAKATPIDADALPLSDSAASNALKKLTWANVKATLKTYFDTLYGTIDDVAAKVAKAGDTMTGLLKLSGDPTDPLHAAPKQYVDSHPGIAKALVNFNGTSPVAVGKAYNVASVVRASTGTYTVNLSVTMSDTNYIIEITDSGTPGGNQHAPRITNVTATSFTFETWNDGGDSYGKSDRTLVCVAVFGDLA